MSPGSFFALPGLNCTAETCLPFGDIYPTQEAADPSGARDTRRNGGARGVWVVAPRGIVGFGHTLHV